MSTLKKIGRLVLSALVVGITFFVLFRAAPFLASYWERARAGEWQEIVAFAVAGLLVLLSLSITLSRIWRAKLEAPATFEEMYEESPFSTETRNEPTPRRQRIRDDGKSSWGCVAGPALFLIVGLGFSLVWVIPGIRSLQALAWDSVPCEIVASSVARHSGEDGATYSIEVVYSYTVDGTPYMGDRYRFLGGSSSGYKGKKEVVDLLPPGTTTTCWVNPKDPTDTVLKRGVSWEFLLVLFPLIFVVVGAIGVFMALATRSKEAEGRTAIDNTSGREATLRKYVGSSDGVLPEVSSGEQVLEPAATPLGKLFGTIFVATFWNGIVGVFVWQLIQEPQLFLGCFLVPFVLVGLLFLFGIPYQLLALANPRPHLRLADGRLQPGGSTTLYWYFSGAARRLQRLTIHLEGRETVKYRGKESTSTQTRPFARMPLVSDPQYGLDQGSVLIKLPREAMHSFSGDRNTLSWVLVLRGTIRYWPDVGEELEVTVVPEMAR